MIKRCTVENIDEIYEIEKESFKSPMKKETMKRDLERCEHYCYALYCEALAGFLSFDKVFDEGQIISVAITPALQGCGLGKKLFDEVLDEAKAMGIRIFTLEVRSDNERAISLYKKVGFKTVGVRKGYYKEPVCDAILMDFEI